MAISKVVLHDDSGADRTLVDLTGDTVAPETLMKGTTAHDKAGNLITGTAKPGGGGKKVQSDWAENDPQNPAYVKNRPFYDSITEEVLIPAQDVAFAKNLGQYMGTISTELVITPGAKYRVSWDGTIYDCVTKEASLGPGGSIKIPYFGNGALLGDEPADYPFVVIYGNAEQPGINAWVVATLQTEPAHNTQISEATGEVVKIPEKFIDYSKFQDTTHFLYINKSIDEWSDEDWVKASDFCHTPGNLVFTYSINQSYKIQVLGIFYADANNKAMVFLRGSGLTFYAIEDGNEIDTTLDSDNVWRVNNLFRAGKAVETQDGVTRFEFFNAPILTAASGKQYLLTVSDDGILGTEPI